MHITLFKERIAALAGGERMLFNAAEVFRDAGHTVVVCHLDAGASAAHISQRLNIGLEDVSFRQLAPTPSAFDEATQNSDLTITFGHRPYAAPQSRRAALVCFFPAAVDVSTSGRWRWRIGQIMRPVQGLLPATLAARLAALPSRAEVVALQSYSRLFSITRYTQRWTRHYWQRDSELLYPLVEPLRALSKTNTIVSVGRFRAGALNKKHEVLVRAFREMVDAGLPGWQLHLIGGLTDEPEHQAYFAELQRAAQGYPIHLHPNLVYPRMADSVGEAALYWHATGFGEDLQRYPDRAEHFGISTVEAMSAGCVPVVIDAGGQAEIVEDGQCGLLWRTLDALKAGTLRLIQQPEHRVELAQRAQQRAAQFCDRAAFNRQVLGLL